MNKINRLSIWLTLAIISFFSILCNSYAQTDPFQIRTEVLPDKIRPGQGCIITVTLTVPSGHYLYADKTNVTPGPAPGLTFGKAKKPKGIKKEDPYLGTVFMYKEDMAIQLPVQAEKSAEPGQKSISLTVNYQGCKKNICFMPQKKELKINLVITSQTDSSASTNKSDSADSPDQEFQDVENIQVPGKEHNPFRKTADRFGLIGVLAAAFLWGLLASLTPCVYPMIPVTMSVIGAGSSGSMFRGFILSVFYVIGLSLTYAIFGTVAAWSGSLFGSYANHPATRIIVAGVFVVMALGMFDVFYIQMPSAISSKLGGRKGTGTVGVFLTGAAAGAVAGPCVGPMLVGLLVYIAALGSKLQGFLIMWSFAIGMGMLFLVIGTFSGAASSLPKSGPWMDRIKQLFGILMIGAALYYVKPLIEADVFTLILGIFFIGTGIFIGALDTLSAESAGWNRLWKTAGIICLVLGTGYVAKFTLGSPITSQPQVVKKSGIPWLRDEESALVQAKEQKKLLMIDFSADWCVACIKFDRETFSNPEVIETAKRFVCVKIDCTDTTDPVVKRLRKKYNVIGLPTIVFVNSSGQILQDMTITEYIKPETFLKRVGKIV